MNKDSVAGAIKETAGSIKSKIGQATGSSKTEASGIKDSVKGNIQKNYGKLKDELDE